MLAQHRSWPQCKANDFGHSSIQGLGNQANGDTRTGAAWIQLIAHKGGALLRGHRSARQLSVRGDGRQLWASLRAGLAGLQATESSASDATASDPGQYLGSEVPPCTVERVHEPVPFLDWRDRASLSRATYGPLCLEHLGGDTCLGGLGRDAHPVGSRAKSASTGNDEASRWPGGERTKGE